MARKTVKTYPQVMKWARETVFGKNKEEAVRRLKISPEELDLMETEEREITVGKLNKLSKIYKRHQTVLMLKTAPRSLEPPKFRKLPYIGDLDFDRKTLTAIRGAQEIQNRAVFLFEDKPNDLIVELRKNKENLSTLVNKTTELLKITPDVRFEGKNSGQQLKIWKRVLEAARVLVLQESFPVKDSRAFTLYNKVAPLIVLSSKDTDNGRIFSLFHELAHLILGQTDSDTDLNLSWKDKDDEYFCNQFSASLLVPKDLIRNSVGENSRVDKQLVEALAYKFKVSKAVIWIRLYVLGLISQNQFNEVKKELSVSEPFYEMRKTKSGGGKNTYLYATINRKSEFYISEVFQAYSARRISYYEVLDYIGVKASVLPKLERLMFT